MDVVGVMAAYLLVVRVCVHEKTITVILAKPCINLPEDGSLLIRNMLEQF